MTSEFCAHCFSVLPASQDHCSVCGKARDAGWQKASFDARLIHALSHPIAEVRTRAIYALGKRGTVSAIDFLVERCLASPKDLAEGQAVVVALTEMPQKAGRDALIRLSTEHPARAIRQLAQEHLKQLA